MPREKRNPNFHYVYKTAVFQIHNPSQIKQKILRDSLRRNHLAYSKLLPIAAAEYDRVSKITGDTKFRKNKARIEHINKCMKQWITPLPLGGASKAGLSSDISSTIAAYSSLMDDYIARIEKDKTKDTDNPSSISKPGVPTFTRLVPKHEAREQAYENLRLSLTKEEEDRARDDIMRENKSGVMRPLLFLKNRINDGFLILYDKTKDKYFIYLNLYSQDSRFAKPINLGGLTDIRTAQTFPDQRINKTGLLFPINFAREFQLMEFMDRDYQYQEFQRHVKSASAKLSEKDGRFEVHVSFEFKIRKLKTKHYLGVDRGIYNLASMCVVGKHGKIIQEENFDGRHLRYVQQKEEKRQRQYQKRGKVYKSSTRKSESDRAVHITANQIVEVAKQFNSQVIIENLSNLTNRSGKRKKSNFNRLLTRAQYTKLQNVLEYKLPLNGLPKPLQVNAAGTSQTCPDCGCWSPDNRKKEPSKSGKEFVMDKFLCVECGYSHDADLNAARIIAIKRMWREALPAKYRTKTSKHLADTKYEFKSYLTSLSKKRKN